MAENVEHQSTFHELVHMLQEEHRRELIILQQKLESELKAKDIKLMDMQKLLDDMLSPDAADDQNEQMNPIMPVPDLGQRNGSKEDSELKEADELQQDTIVQAEMGNIRQMVGKTKVLTDRRSAPGFRRKLLNIVQHSVFEVICAIAITSNSLLIGLQIDYSARHESDPEQPPAVYQTLDQFYCLWFIVELILKMAAYGCLFFRMDGWTWNVFDSIVVGTDALQTLMSWLALDSSNLGSLTFLRILRVLRVTRVVRVVRLVRFFRELRIMIASVVKSGASLMWSILMFTAIIYIFGIFLLTPVVQYVYEHKSDVYYENYRRYWRSLPQAMWTLFSCMTGGLNWSEIGDPLLHIHKAWGLAMGFFMFFTIFVVANIITGIFVDGAIEKARSDRDEMVQQDLSCRDSAFRSLKQLFEEADTDRSGSLTLEKFEHHLQKRTVNAMFDAMGLHVDAARDVFRLIDSHSANAVGIEEFIFGCMRYKGSATSIDLAKLNIEHRRGMAELRKLHDSTIGKLGIIQHRLEKEDRVQQSVLPAKSSLITI